MFGFKKKDFFSFSEPGCKKGTRRTEKVTTREFWRRFCNYVDEDVAVNKKRRMKGIKKKKQKCW